MTELHEQIYRGSFEELARIVEAGVEINAKDEYGFTALDLVNMSISRYTRIQELLKQHGAKS